MTLNSNQLHTQKILEKYPDTDDMTWSVALELALRLAIEAPSEEKKDECVRQATLITQGMTKEEVEAVQTRISETQ